jgi:hypothetical protein
MIAADPEETFRLLSYVLHLLPPTQRAACTFDTFVDNCIPSAGSFWTIGSTKTINTSSFVPMRLAERRAAAVKRKEAHSAYSAWFSYALQQAQSLEQIDEDLSTAQMVAEAFTTRNALPNEPLSEHALYTFQTVNKQAIDSRISTILSAVVNEPITEAFTPSLYRYFTSSAVLSIAAQGTCKSDELARAVYRWLLSERPKWKEWEHVLKFAQRANYAPLLLLASIKARHPLPLMSYEKLHLQAMGILLDSEQLPQVLNDLLGGSQTGQSPTRRFELSDEEFRMVVHALLRLNAGNLLQDLCVQRLALVQDRQVLHKLTKAVDASQHVPPEFVQALHQHPLYSK